MKIRYRNRRHAKQYKTSHAYIAGIFAILVMMVGIWLVISVNHTKQANDQYMETAVAVDATCTKVWSKRSGGKHKTTRYYASAAYSYESKSYECDKIRVNHKTKVGDVITVYIQPDNPSQWTTGYTTSEYVFSLIFSGSAILVGGIILLSVITNHAKYKKNKRNDQNNIPYSGNNNNNPFANTYDHYMNGNSSYNETNSYYNNSNNNYNDYDNNP